MSLHDCIDVTLCIRLLQTLGHFLWQGVFIFLLLWLATFLMQRCSPSARYTVSLLALLLMAICPAVTFMLIDNAKPEDAVVTAAMPVLPTSPVISHSESLTAPMGAQMAMTKTQAPLFKWQKYAPYIVIGYLSGVWAMLCRLLLAIRGGRRLRHESESIEDPRLLVALTRQAKHLGLSYTPAIGYCRHVVVPTVIGVLRPMILLPISMNTGLNAEQIELLLAHELAHIRRYDPLVNILQRVIEAVLFFHPCVWLISQRIRIERENCCDDIVLAGGVNDATYADMLLQMAEIVITSHNKHSLAAVVGIGAADSFSELRQRVLRVIEDPTYKPIRLASGFNFALILVGLATLLAVFQLTASGNLKGMDDLTTKPIVDRNVYILGQVMQPGAYPIFEGEERTMSQLITTAGTYNDDEIEDASVTLSRYGADGKRHIILTLGLKTVLEYAGDDIFLRNGDLVTLSSEPIYRPQHSLGLIVGADRITLDGQDVTWDNLPAMLRSILDRPYTKICMAMAEDNVPTAEHFEAAVHKVDEMVDKYGFEERVFFQGGPKPLGTQACGVEYVPIESMHYSLASKEAIPVDQTLLQKHTTDPPGRALYSVRLVIGADRMTFQGKDVTWDTLPAVLQAVPNRDQTRFEIAEASDSPPGEKFLDAKTKAYETQQKFGFDRFLDFGSLSIPLPLGSMGMLTRYVSNYDQ